MQRPRAYAQALHRDRRIPGAAAHVHRLQTSLSVLRDSTPIVCCPGVEEVGSSVTPESIAWYKERFGDDYYSFYRSGVYFIVVNSPLLCVLGECGSADGTRELAEAHAAWLEKELMTGKLCAVHVAVVSHHKWLSGGRRVRPARAAGSVSSPLSRIWGSCRRICIVGLTITEATATSHGGQTGNELEQDFKQVASGRVSVGRQSRWRPLSRPAAFSATASLLMRIRIERSLGGFRWRRRGVRMDSTASMMMTTTTPTRTLTTRFPPTRKTKASKLLYSMMYATARICRTMFCLHFLFLIR